MARVVANGNDELSAVIRAVEEVTNAPHLSAKRLALAVKLKVAVCDANVATRVAKQQRAALGHGASGPAPQGGLHIVADRLLVEKREAPPRQSALVHRGGRRGRGGGGGGTDQKSAGLRRLLPGQHHSTAPQPQLAARSTGSLAEVISRPSLRKIPPAVAQLETLSHAPSTKMVLDKYAYPYLQPLLAKFPVLVSSPEHALPAMLLIVYGSKLVHATLSFLLVGKYDNVNASYRLGGGASSGSKPTWQSKVLVRAYNAHSNHWEAFTGFSVAVMSALRLSPGSQTHELTILANAFIGVRLLYNVVYIIAYNEPLSFLRSAVWFAGIVITLRIFTLSLSG